MTPTQPLGEPSNEAIRTACAYLLTLFNLAIWLIVANRLQELFK